MSGVSRAGAGGRSHLGEPGDPTLSTPSSLVGTKALAVLDCSGE